MSDNPGQDDVSIGVGATISQASLETAKEVLKAWMQSTKQDLETAFGSLKVLPSTEYSSADLQGAYDQLKSSIKGVGTEAEGMASKTATAMGNMGQLTDAYRAKVDSMKAAIKDYAAQSGASYTDIQKAVAPSLGTADRSAFNQAVKESVKDQKDAEKAAKDLKTQQDDLKTSTISLGDVFRVVFGVTLMQLGVQAFRAIINVMKEAIQAGVDYAQTLFRLTVAVRDMQRGGADVTIKDFTDLAAALQKQFPTFSLQSMVSGISDAVLLTKELGFTKDQMGEVAKASVTLASIWGKDVNEVMRTMALTLSSGYSEGLQRLGININKVVITEKAHTMGIKEGYNAMTQQQRAMAAMAVILEQVNGMQEDATQYQQTAPGRIDKLTAAWTDFKREVGTNTLEILARLADFLITILKTMTDITHISMKIDVGGVAIALSALAVPMAVFIVNLDAISRFFHGQPLSIKEYFDNLAKAIKSGISDANAEAKKLLVPEISLGDTSATPKVVSDLLDSYGLSDEDKQKVLDASDDLNTKLEDLAKQGAEKLAQIELDKARDLAKIDENLHRDLIQAEIDYQRNLEKAATDNQRKLADIDLNNARARADAQLSLTRDLEKVEQDYQQSVSDAKLKYQQKQVDDEAKYQLKIKQMQEQYLYDIDEAIRSGNAKQALQINRRLKLEYGQAQETHASDVGQMQTDFGRQLAELEREKQLKIEQRNQEFQQKLADLALQAAQEKADEAVRYQQQLVDEATQYALKKKDLATKAAQDRIDRETQYQQQLTDLATSQNDQLRTLGEGLVKQYNLTTKMLDATYKAYLLVYGPSGALDKLYVYAVAAAQKAGADIAAGLGQQMTGTYQPGWQGNGPGAAEGGSFIASRPMNLNIGERGAELVSVTPLSYLGKNTGKLFGNLPVSVGNGQSKGKLDIQILLSSDLEARIVNSSVDAMSDVMVSVERESR